MYQVENAINNHKRPTDHDKLALGLDCCVFLTSNHAILTEQKDDLPKTANTKSHSNHCVYSFKNSKHSATLKPLCVFFQKQQTPSHTQTTVCIFLKTANTQPHSNHCVYFSKTANTQPHSNHCIFSKTANTQSHSNHYVYFFKNSKHPVILKPLCVFFQKQQTPSHTQTTVCIFLKTANTQSYSNHCVYFFKNSKHPVILKPMVKWATLACKSKEHAGSNSFTYFSNCRRRSRQSQPPLRRRYPCRSWPKQDCLVKARLSVPLWFAGHSHVSSCSPGKV